MSFKKISFLFLIFLFSFSIFNFAGAASLVPCGPGSDSGKACTLCDFTSLAHNVVSFIITAAFAIAILVMLYGGFTILTAGDSTARMESGRKMILQTVIGLAILLSSWLIIDTTMKVFVGSTSPTSWGPWNTFPDCAELQNLIKGKTTTGAQSTGGPTQATPTTNPNQYTTPNSGAPANYQPINQINTSPTPGF